MTGQRGALRVAVVAVIAAALITPAVPAHAQPADLRLGGVGNVELKVGGGAQNVQLRVENRGLTDAEQVSLTMTVPLTDLGVHIASAPNECELSNNNTRMDCLVPNIPANQAWSGVAQVAVHGNSPLQAGESRNGNGELTLNNFNQGREQFNVRLKGPDKAPAVAEISGIVTDIDTGEPIEGARVTLVDSQGIDFTTTTDANGAFRFAGEQIAPGSLALKASKEGFEGRENIQQGEAGDSVTDVQLTLASTATPTPSASPTPTATGSGTPTVAAAPPVEPTSSGLSFFTRLMIFLGVIFLLLGAAAIGYLIYRRRKEAREFDDGDDGFAGADDPTSGPRGPQPSPGSRGVYHPTPTQVRGAGPATAVGPSAALANAETSLIPRAGAADATALHARSGGAEETSLLPRAGGEPPGPRPPVPGSPPPPRSAAPTYGSGPRTQPYGSPVDPHSGAAAPYRGGEYAAPERGAPDADGPRHGAAGYDGAGGHGAPGYGAAGYGDRGYGEPGYGEPGQQGYDPSRYAGPAGRGEPAAGYGPDPYARRDGGHGGAGYGGDGYQSYDSPTQQAPGYERGGGYQDPRYQGYEPGHRAGYDQAGYQGGGYDQAGYRGGYDQGGYQQPAGYGEAGYEQSGYDRAGYDRAGYDRAGYDQAGYPQAGYGEPGYGQAGYGEPGYGEPGYDPRTDATGAYPRQPAPGTDRRRPPDWRPE